MTWEGLIQRNGKYCSIRRMEYLEFQTGIFGRMESALCLYLCFFPLERLSKVLLFLEDKYKSIHSGKIRGDPGEMQ